MKTAPVALFVYKRITHVRRVIEALQQNTLARESDLFIYSDAPKNSEAAEEVSEVREYIRIIGGFRSISIVERDKNWGLANSIIDGVTRLCNEYGQVIVMEDDLVTSPYFLRFMNEALNIYQGVEKVMHISGYMYPVDAFGLSETFFLQTASCWGWATWDRAWKHFRKEPKELLGEYTKQTIKRFNMDGACDFWTQVKQNESGLINTWAVFWYATVFQANGLCLHPASSMVNNIGHDNTGEHCMQTNVFFITLANKPITYFDENIIESTLATFRTREFYLALKRPLLQRIFTAIKRRLTL